MKFLLVLSDAFDALWAIRGRVALALAGVALLGLLVAIYLPMLTGDEPQSPPPAAAHNPSVQGPVERARPAPQAAAPAPAPQPAAATDAGAAAQPVTAPEPLPLTERAPATEQAPAPEPEPTPAAAPAPAAAPVFQVQVGAFREAARAQKLAHRLTRSGFPTSVMRGTTSDGKPIFRVRTRQALPRGEAQQLVARLRQRQPALRPILVRAGEAAG